MVHPTFGSEMMFGSDHKSHRQPDELFLLLGKLSASDGPVLVVQLGRRQADSNPDELYISPTRSEERRILDILARGYERWR
jgi:hypothetical protein